MHSVIVYLELDVCSSKRFDVEASLYGNFVLSFLDASIELYTHHISGDSLDLAEFLSCRTVEDNHVSLSRCFSVKDVEFYSLCILFDDDLSRNFKSNVKSGRILSWFVFRCAPEKCRRSNSQ